MKILYLLQQFPKISSEAFILNEMIELQKMGHDVWVLADKVNYLNEYELHAVIIENDFMKKIVTGEVYSRGIYKLSDFLKKVSSDLISNPRATFKNLYLVLLNNPYYKDKNIWSKLDNYLILRKLPKLKFDLIYSPFGHLEKIDKGLAIANIVDAPFATAFRALELYGDKCRKQITTYKKIFSKISSIVTISKFNKKQLEEVFGTNQEISIIHSSIDPERFLPLNKKITENKIQLITIARFVEKKGIDYLLEALSTLKDEGINFEHLLIGDGPLLEIYKLRIKELGLSNVVKILAPMKQERIKSALGASDIMILPCIVASNGDRDIMANVLKEAMAMEVPVITSDISGIEELINNRQNGLLVPEKDVPALVGAIKELINNQVLRTEIAKEGRKKIISDFNVKIEAQKLSSLFLETAKKFNDKEPEPLNINTEFKEPTLDNSIKAILDDIIVRCNGLLPPDVYMNIYECALKAKSGNMLEIGSAHGAASICIARGITDSGKNNHLIAVEKGEGNNSSMEKFGSKDFNIGKLEANIKYFNCEQNILVIPNRVSEVADEIKNHAPFSLIFIDADGAIDRDFMLFYNSLKPGADIIIDDYEDFKDTNSLSKTNPLGKSYVTYKFVNYFLEAGLIEKKKIVGNTIFCHKPEKINYSVEFNKEKLQTIRENIIIEAKRIK